MAANGLDPRSLARLRLLPQRIAQGQEAALGKAAFVAKRTIQRQPGYRDRLSGVGKRGARLNIRYDVKGRGLNAVALVRATGPFHLLERDTKPHRIGPRRRGRDRKRAVVTPYGPKASVQHPGTKGKHPFEKGVAAAMPAMRRELRDGLVNAFRG